MKTFSRDYSFEKLAQESRNVVDRKQYIDKERFVCLFKEKGDLNMFNSCGGG